MGRPPCRACGPARHGTGGDRGEARRGDVAATLRPRTSSSGRPSRRPSPGVPPARTPRAAAAARAAGAARPGECGGSAASSARHLQVVLAPRAAPSPQELRVTAGRARPAAAGPPASAQPARPRAPPTTGSSGPGVRRSGRGHLTGRQTPRPPRNRSRTGARQPVRARAQHPGPTSGRSRDSLGAQCHRRPRLVPVQRQASSSPPQASGWPASSTMISLCRRPSRSRRSSVTSSASSRPSASALRAAGAPGAPERPAATRRRGRSPGPGRGCAGRPDGPRR